MDTLQLTKTNGETYEMSASDYGHLIHDTYQQMDFVFAAEFIRYRRQHVTATLAANLKAGMDDISCALIDHLEDMYDLLPMLPKVMVSNAAVFTPEDHQRYQLWQQMVASKSLPPQFAQLPSFCPSEYVNKYGLYDSKPQVLDYINGKDVIDGGAYIGDTMLLFHELFPQSRLYAIEPASTNVKYMQERTLCELLKTDTPRVFTVHAGVGEHHDRMTITKPSGFSTYSLLFTEENTPNYKEHRSASFVPDSEEVDIIAIDDLVQERHLNVGLIKLDIEGFEPHALRGALHTIKTQRPVIISAIYHTPEEYYELKPYLESLDLGYDFKLRYSGSRQPYYETVLIATPQQLK